MFVLLEKNYMFLRKTLVASLAAVLIPGVVCAQRQPSPRDLQSQVADLSEMVRSLRSVIDTQQQQIDALSQQVKREPAGVNAAASSSVSPAVTSGGAFARGGGGVSGGQFNPDIGLVGDIVGALSESGEDAEGNDRISAREVELVVGHDVDPYSRFDATIAFSDEEDPHVEEAYASLWGLPGELKAKLGRLRPRIGVATAQHRDSLDTVDEPLVVQRYLGHEGLDRTGIELSTYTPSVFETVTHEFIAGVMEGGIGEEGTLFGETRRRPSFYARIKNSIDVSDTTLLNLGSTFLIGSADEDAAYESRAVGLDFAVSHHISSYQHVKWQTEAYIQDRSTGYQEDGAGEASEVGDAVSFRSNPWGMYSLLDLRFAERWAVGARFDYVEPVNRDEGTDGNETAYSAYLTFFQSEFSRWRFQYQFADTLDNDSDNRFFVQATFAIGNHKHQLQ